ncbi:hypothetical protein [Geminocystis sp. NIES-3708]|uniref:hypothetical protein n=1 Tax=Geminocystis sp. NIES-3708 TaxID=1615909 RepID=UPI00082CF4CF|nr:hypothetical protein [Geminocystis sp. NIES-3708]
MPNSKTTTFVTSQLKLYTLLSQLKFPKSYLGKIMLVAFLGTHIPLLSLFFYAIAVTSLTTDAKIGVADLSYERYGKGTSLQQK